MLINHVIFGRVIAFGFSGRFFCIDSASGLGHFTNLNNQPKLGVIEVVDLTAANPAVLRQWNGVEKRLLFHHDFGIHRLKRPFIGGWQR